jgi:hypothetical protein
VSTQRDYYEILGAREDASPHEIERLYKRQARQRHPDRGGAEDDMKALNEAYGVLHDAAARTAYDHARRKPKSVPREIYAAPAAREVGVYGQLLSALLAISLGLMLLLLVRFNGLWFLWPLSILALAVIIFGVMLLHSAMRNARHLLPTNHLMRRFTAIQELAFWGAILGAGVGLYLVMGSI